MGLIKAFTGAISGALADQWLEVLEPDQMTGSTVFTNSVPVRQDDRHNQNRKEPPTSSPTDRRFTSTPTSS